MRKEVVVMAMGALLTCAAGYAAVDEGGAGARRRETPEAAGFQSLADELRSRERSLERRELSVTERERELRAIEARLAERAKTLEELRAGIDELREQVDQEQRARVESIARSMETMKPASAAKVLQALDLPLAIDAVRLMGRSKAGKVLAAMSPANAARITEGLARAPRSQPVQAPTP
jgi:flagellar motility protein MotE (MotC chaperone)